MLTPEFLATANARLKKTNPELTAKERVIALAMTYHIPPAEVTKKLARIAHLRKNVATPPAAPYVNDVGDIIWRGRKIASCTELTERPRHHAPWLRVEVDSLRIQMREAMADDEKLHTLCHDDNIVAFFGRTADAIYARASKLK